MAHVEKRKPKGLPKRYGSAGRKVRRARHFERRGKPYTGR
jgi:hypothetical protein